MIVSYSDVAIALGAVTLATLSGSALHETCAPRDTMSQRLSKADQRLTATGWTASNERVNLFVNDASGRWTLTVTGPGDLTCPIAQGTRFDDAEIDGYLTPVSVRSN